jgi:hypothetical protein
MQAKRELKGPNDGAVYPALLRGKTVDVSNYTRGQPTILESSPMPSAAEFYDEASKKLGSTASHEEIYDLAESLADDAFADWVPTGQLADFADGIRESAQQYGFENIRSRFAQFDPAKAGSADILAGLAGLGVLGAGAAALPQDDSDMVSALRGM